MPLPLSKSQLDRLGQRLAATDTVADADHELLQDVLNAAYGQALTGVRRRLEELGFTVTARLKTIGTLIEKLRREQGLRLSRVQDLAGVRLVVAGTRRDQDEAVALIVRDYAGADRAPHVRDRRQHPSSGYRAVHVIVFADGVPVEVQVRTALQDRWAQDYERLADRWGRAMRYGGEPNEPDAVAVAGLPDLTRRRVVELMQGVSHVFAAFETAELASGRYETMRLPEFEETKASLGSARHAMEVTLDIVSQIAN